MRISDHRQAWIQRIVESQPRIFLTIPFLPPSIHTRFGVETTASKMSGTWRLSDEQATETASTLMTRISQKTYGRKLQGGFVGGIGCLEYQKSGQPHFHIVSPSDITPERFQEVFTNVVKSARRASRTHHVPNVFRHLDTNSLDVVTIEPDEVERYARYSTKCFQPEHTGHMVELTTTGNKIVILG